MAEQEFNEMECVEANHQSNINYKIESPCFINVLILTISCNATIQKRAKMKFAVIVLKKCDKRLSKCFISQEQVCSWFTCSI